MASQTLRDDLKNCDMNWIFSLALGGTELRVAQSSCSSLLPLYMSQLLECLYAKHFAGYSLRALKPSPLILVEFALSSPCFGIGFCAGKHTRDFLINTHHAPARPS